MRQFLSTTLFLLVLTTSCQEEEAPMEAERFANILTELHLAESFAQVVPVNMGDYETKNFDTLKTIYASIYKENNIDTARFNLIVDWYEQHPKLFDTVYEMVLENISILKEQSADSTQQMKDTTDFIN